MTKAALSDAPVVRDSADYRRPSQKRSKDRFEAILDTAERLLESSDPSAISIHKIAAELGMSAASIYHFFPEAPLVFAALAERYLHLFETSDPSADHDFETWQELQTHNFRAGRDFFNGNVPARKVLLLGPAFSYDIRKQDLQSDVIMAARGIEQMQRHFVVPDIPGLLERSTEVIVISDALWALSILRHGTITEEMEEQARRARIAYARTYLPEYLPRRRATDGARWAGAPGRRAPRIGATLPPPIPAPAPRDGRRTMSDATVPASAPVALGAGQMAACLAIGSIALLVLGVQPVLLGPLVVEGRIAESGVGQLVTAELLAIALGSLLGTRLLRQQLARTVAVAGGLLLALANAAMTIHGGAALLLGLRGVAGLAEGLLLALPVVAIARAAHPERTSAYFLVAQTLLQLIVAAIMPNLLYGGSRADAGFLVLAGAGIVGALLAIGAPAWLRPAAPDASGGAITPRSAAALFAAGAYLGGIVVVWSYFGLWLTLHGHPPAMEGRAVALSLGAQVVGALIASRVSDRLSSGYVIMACAAGEAALVAVLLAWGGSAAVVYVVSAAFGLLWLFALPSFTGLLIEIDPRRRAALYLAAAQLIGSALLPLVAGPWIDRIGVNGASWIGIAAFICTVVAIAACRPRRVIADAA